MKALFGIVSLLLVLGVVTVLVKKQLAAPTAPSSSAAPGNGTPVPTLQDAPTQVKQQVEGLMQKPRDVPEEK